MIAALHWILRRAIANCSRNKNCKRMRQAVREVEWDDAPAGSGVAEMVGVGSSSTTPPSQSPQKRTRTDCAEVDIDRLRKLTDTLYIYCMVGYTNDALALIDRGANIEGNDDGGQTPLILACALGRAEIARALIDSGANIYATDNILAADTLLTHGAAVNAKKNKDGETPLHIAVRNGGLSLVETLLAHGADVHACKNGESPRRFASADLFFDAFFNSALNGLRSLRSRRPVSSASALTAAAAAAARGEVVLEGGAPRGGSSQPASSDSGSCPNHNQKRCDEHPSNVGATFPSAFPSSNPEQDRMRALAALSLIGCLPQEPVSAAAAADEQEPASAASDQ
jgi:hypothetical protein